MKLSKYSSLLIIIMCRLLSMSCFVQAFSFSTKGQHCCMPLCLIKFCLLVVIVLAVTFSGYNSSVEKERLGNIMAYGTEVEEKDQSSKEKRRAQRHQEEEEVDRFEEGRPVIQSSLYCSFSFLVVLQEIEERKEFLEEMEALGKGEEYRARIMTEISQRVRELETMDRQRSTQLGIKESLKNT